VFDFVQVGLIVSIFFHLCYNVSPIVEQKSWSSGKSLGLGLGLEPQGLGLGLDKKVLVTALQCYAKSGVTMHVTTAVDEYI